MTAPTFLRGRKGAFLALGAIVLLFALVFALPVAALFRAQADDRAEALDHSQPIAPRTHSDRRSWRVLRRFNRARNRSRLLTASSAALAQAQLQSDMKELIDAWRRTSERTIASAHKGQGIRFRRDRI